MGHLVIAQDAIEQVGLDCLYFIPAAQAPLKGYAPEATNEQRLAMLELAVEEHTNMQVLDIEIQRGGTSYTFDTVSALVEHFPGAELFWLIGADQLEKLPKWHRFEELLSLVQFVCSTRPGHSPAIPEEVDPERVKLLKERLIPISSTEVRQKMADSHNADFFLPPKVTEFIKNNRLYCSK